MLVQLGQSYLVLPNSSEPASGSQLGSNYRFCWWFQSVNQWKHRLSELRHMIRSTLLLLLFRVGEKWIAKFKTFLAPPFSAHSSLMLGFFWSVYITESKHLSSTILNKTIKKYNLTSPPSRPSRILCESKLLCSHPKLLEFQTCI